MYKRREKSPENEKYEILEEETEINLTKIDLSGIKGGQVVRKASYKILKYWRGAQEKKISEKW